MLYFGNAGQLPDVSEWSTSQLNGPSELHLSQFWEDLQVHESCRVSILSEIAKIDLPCPELIPLSIPLT